MPKIPLYNQGQGAAVQTAAGALSPRANVGAFTAPGQAQAAFAKQASDVAFRFAEEQARAETNRVYSEELKQFDEQQLDFNLNNKDTDTTVYETNYETFSTKFINGIKTRTDLNDTQKEKITQKLMPSITASKLQGTRQAYDRGQKIRTTAANEGLGLTINKIGQTAIGSPERQRLVEEAHATINESITDGLGIDYSIESFDRGMMAQDFGIRTNNAQSVADLNLLRDEVKDNVALGFKTKEAIKANILQKENDLRSDLYQKGVELIQSAEYTFDEAEAAQEAIYNGKVLTLGGQTYNPSNLKATQRGQLASILSGEQSDLEDLSTQNVQNSLSESENFLEASRELFKTDTAKDMWQSEEMREEMILDVAENLTEQVVASISAGDLSNVQALSDQLQTVTSVINEDFRGAGSLLQRDGALGDTAAQLQQKVATATKNLTKAVNTGNKNSLLGLSLGKGNFNETAMHLNATTSEKQDAVNNAVMSLRSEEGELVNQPILNILSANAVTSDFLKGTLEASSNLITDPSFKIDDSDLGRQNRASIAESVEAYKAMKIRGNVLNNHITDNNVMATYAAIEVLEPYYGLDGAIEQVRGFDKDIDRANAKYKDIEKEVNTISDDGTKFKWYAYVPFFEGVEYTPVNKASMAADVGNLTKLMIRKGLEGKEALKAAATLYGERHIRVMNVVLPKTDSIPTQEAAESVEGNMTAALQSLFGVQEEFLQFTEGLTEIKPEFARQAAVISSKRDQAMKSGAISGKIDYISENYEIDDLMFIPRVPGSYDEWTLATTTMQPVFMNDQGTPLTFTDDQLMMYGDILGYENKERARIEKNAELWIENNANLRTGPFAGKTIQQIQQEKERLKGVSVIDFSSMDWLFGDKKTRQEKLDTQLNNWESWAKF